MDKKRNKKIKEAISKTPAKTPKRVRFSVSASWQAIDAILNHLRETYRSNPPLFHKAVILPLTVRLYEWYSFDTRRTLCHPHKVRPRHSRKNNPSKRSNMVSKPRNDKANQSKSRPFVLPANFNKSL